MKRVARFRREEGITVRVSTARAQWTEPPGQAAIARYGVPEHLRTDKRPESTLDLRNLSLPERAMRLVEGLICFGRFRTQDPRLG
jgi:hypothetical protein